MTSINEPITFWKLLEKKVEIPIIQRDYAQGRRNQAILRNRFLDELINADFKKEKPLVLDYIYGNECKEAMNPLDGQQRLTTLFLLYWYLAYKTESLNDENKKRLGNFTYQTRISSCDFCEAIIQNNIVHEKLEKNKTNLSDQIANQTWFFSSWKQDPTIQSMLVMIDAIEEEIKQKFKDKDLKKYWEALIGEKSPILFYYLSLVEFQISDEAYVKMNARGKKLTNFENFKADFFDFLLSEYSEKCVEIFKKVDNEWTDIFWKNNNEGEIDSIYLAFLNRYFLNELICDKEKEEYKQGAQEIEKDLSFKEMYKDCFFEYQSFDIYKKILTSERIERLKKTMSFLAESKGIEVNVKSSWGESIDFVPKYINQPHNAIPKFITQKQRILFYAIAKYLEQGVQAEEELKRWMRVVWNIVENTDVNSVTTMIGCMRLIDELSEGINNIYSFLCKKENLKSKVAEVQINEEREKARMICQKKEWEDKILAAEKLALLKGSICCLFRKGRDDNGNDIYDWNLFDNRLKKIKEYFEEESGEMKKDYKTDSKLLRHFIALFTIPEHFKVLEYDNRPATWKNILKEPLYIEVLNKFFVSNFDSNSKVTLENFSSRDDKSFEFLQKDLCESKVLNFVAKGSYLKFHHQKLSLSPKYARKDIFVLADERNMILSELEKKNIIKISNKHIVEKKLPYFKGWDIEFKYNEENYIYRTQNDLYKTEEEKKEMSPKELYDFLGGD